MDAKQIRRRLDALRSQRLKHESVWLDCLDHTFPYRADGFGRQDYGANAGAQRRATLLDATGTDAARILASAIMGGVTPANSRWFQLEVPKATEEERRWLDEQADRLWRNIHGANFDAAGFEAALDAVSLGWFVLYIDEAEGGGLRFDTWPAAQCYIAATKPGGTVDIVYREYDLTAEQAVGDFGDAVSEATRKLASDKPDELVRFVHAIEPRQGARPGSLFARDLPFASYHLEVKADRIVRERGYHEFPCVVPRWQLLPASHYAVGPAADALPDMRTLNDIKRMELAACDLAIAGMWIAEDDGVLNPRTVKVGPRKVIVANSVDSMKALETGADFNVAFTQEERLQAAIRRVFMADQLQPQDGPQMTAYEVHVRVGLLRQLLGPVYGRLQAEYLQPMIARCFGLAQRAGVFPPMPSTLANRAASVKYISPLARAQSLEEVSAMDQYELALAQEAQVDPSVLDNYDFDEAARTRAQLLGVPAKLTRSARDVAKRRAMRQQAQAEAQAQAVQTEGASAMAQAAGTRLGNQVAA